jgi:hypothetical protein
MFEISQTFVSSPLDACLREAASAKAGGRVKVGSGKKGIWSPLSLSPPTEGGEILGRICLINYGVLSKGRDEIGQLREDAQGEN